MIHPDIHYSYPVISKKNSDRPPKSTDYAADWREFFKQNPYGNAYEWLQFVGAENRQGNITAEECNDILRQLSLKSFESGYKLLIMWMPEYLGKEGRDGHAFRAYFSGSARFCNHPDLRRRR